MSFLKGLGVSILSFLLFLSLSVFGLAFALNSTVLSADFATSELNKLDVSAIVEDVFVEQNPEEGLESALVTAISEAEPIIKEQVNVAIYEIYDYLKGKTEDLDLALTLKNTVLSSDFMVSVVDELDMSSIVKEPLSDKIAKEIPADSQYITQYLDDSLDEVITELKPWMKQQISAAAGPLTDYLLGNSQSFNVAISWGPVIESLRDHLQSAFLQSPPPEFAMLSRAQLEQKFTELYQQFSAQMPSTFTLDESLFGDTPPNLADGLAEAEKALGNARQYVHYFQLGYPLLIVFMVLLVAGIALINRNVRVTTRSLGVTALIDGVIGFVGIVVGGKFLESLLAQIDAPASLQAWMPQLAGDLLSPMKMFSIGVMVAGVVLIIVSIVYRRKASSGTVS